MTEIILGPPGTGKTTTLINLVEEELQRGTPPDRIGYLSFTKKAAAEAQDRARARFGLQREDLPYFSTLHALCYRQLGLRRGDVLEGRRMQAFGEYAGIQLSDRVSEDGTTFGFQRGERALFMEHLARVRCVPLRQQFDDCDDELDWPFVQDIDRRLRVYKAAHGLLDYTDMLSEFLRGGTCPRLDVLIGDEAQDMSSLQWLVFWKLAAGCRRVAVAGDDDQAIYVWAGADVQHLIEMPGDVRVLGQSWRVPPAVQRVADRLTSVMGRRREKEWRPRADAAGEVTRVPALYDADVSDEWREGTETPPVLVLVRNTYLIKTHVAPLLRSRGVVYEYRGRPSLSLGLVQAARQWERLRRGEPLTGSELHDVLEWMSAGVGFARGTKTWAERQGDGLVTMRELRDGRRLLRDDVWFDAFDRAPTEDKQYVRRARRAGESLRGRPRVMISTIHSAKGGEADHVVLLKEMAARTHREAELRPADEARVWYVATTRARSKLTIVDAERGNRSCPWL